MKYAKPKILLLDLSKAAETALTTKGFNVSVGTLGRPYRVAKSSSYQALVGKAEAPNHTEQEIVVIDLGFDGLQNEAKGQKHRPDGESDLWGKCDQGFLDPRVRSAYQLKGAFDRIHSTGGVFIVFADAKTDIHVQVAKITQYNQLYDVEEFGTDAWDFLSELSDMIVYTDHGSEMKVVKSDSPLTRLLGAHLQGGQFTCKLEGGCRTEDEWEPLVVNKFGDVVGMARCRANKGSVIVVPQIQDKTGFVSQLFTDVLPEIVPHLFPHIEGGKWTHLPEYELPRVIELRSKQKEAEQRASAETLRLEGELSRACRALWRR